MIGKPWNWQSLTKEIAKGAGFSMRLRTRVLLPRPVFVDDALSDIREASGYVAGMHDDISNLAIVMDAARA